MRRLDDDARQRRHILKSPPSPASAFSMTPTSSTRRPMSRFRFFSGSPSACRRRHRRRRLGRGCGSAPGGNSQDNSASSPLRCGDRPLLVAGPGSLIELDAPMTAISSAWKSWLAVCVLGAAMLAQLSAGAAVLRTRSLNPSPPVKRIRASTSAHPPRCGEHDNGLRREIRETVPAAASLQRPIGRGLTSAGGRYAMDEGKIHDDSSERIRMRTSRQSWLGVGLQRIAGSRIAKHGTGRTAI